MRRGFRGVVRLGAPAPALRRRDAAPGRPARFRSCHFPFTFTSCCAIFSMASAMDDSQASVFAEPVEEVVAAGVDA